MRFESGRRSMCGSGLTNTLMTRSLSDIDDDDEALSAPSPVLRRPWPREEEPKRAFMLLRNRLDPRLSQYRYHQHAVRIRISWILQQLAPHLLS